MEGFISGQVVTLCDTWRHIENRDRDLGLMNKMLKPDGEVVMVDCRKAETPVGPPPPALSTACSGSAAFPCRRGLPSTGRTNATEVQSPGRSYAFLLSEQLVNITIGFA